MSEPVLLHSRWESLRSAVGDVPPGRWAVGVSGGADSVALLRLLVERDEISLHVVHLDHETRAGESALDAKFVGDLALQLNLPVTIACRSDVQKRLRQAPGNLSAQFRAARLELFRQVVTANDLSGVILAHHADDQAETILHRLIRGSPPTALAGMSPRATVEGLRILRPLLAIRTAELREFLDEIAQAWREDSSNNSPKYLRNQLRMILSEDPKLHDSLLKLGQVCRGMKKWLTTTAPILGAEIQVLDLAATAKPLARHAVSRWLTEQGAPADQISAETCERLITMALDAASPSRQHFPGGLLVRRRRGVIFVDRPEKQKADCSRRDADL